MCFLAQPFKKQTSTPQNDSLLFLSLPTGGKNTGRAHLAQCGTVGTNGGLPCSLKVLVFPSQLEWKQLFSPPAVIFQSAALSRRAAASVPSHFSRICTVSPISSGRPCWTVPRKLASTKNKKHTQENTHVRLLFSFFHF